MGTQMTALDAAFKALNKSTIGAAAAAAVSSADTQLAIASIIGLNAPAVTAAGKGLGSLGVALLGANAVLHLLVLFKCGGAEHHPEHAHHKPTARATLTMSVSTAV